MTTARLLAISILLAVAASTACHAGIQMQLTTTVGGQKYVYTEIQSVTLTGGVAKIVYNDGWPVRPDTDVIFSAEYRAMCVNLGVESLQGQWIGIRSYESGDPMRYKMYHRGLAGHIRLAIQRDPRQIVLLEDPNPR